MSDVGDDVVAVPEVRGEHAVVSGEVGAWAWDQRGKPGNEVEGVEDDVSGPVTEGVLDSSSTVSPEVRRLKSNAINNLGVVQSDHSLECSGKS